MARGAIPGDHTQSAPLDRCCRPSSRGIQAPGLAPGRRRLLVAWQEAVFTLYLTGGKIEPEVVASMRGWRHSGFSVDQPVFLPAGDRAAIERLVEYITRCPFSLSRLVKLTKAGQVVYKAEKDACRAFPDPRPMASIPGRSGISRSSHRWTFWRPSNHHRRLSARGR